MTGPLIELRVAELAGVWPAHTVVDAHRRIEAARVVLRFARDRAHDAAFVRAAADCIPGLVAALGSEEQPVWSAALCLLSLACGVAHGSEGNSWAIAAAGGIEALSQLVLAHSSDATTLSNACSVPGADNGATAASGTRVWRRHCCSGARAPCGRLRCRQVGVADPPSIAGHPQPQPQLHNPDTGSWSSPGCAAAAGWSGIDIWQPDCHVF